MSGNVFQVSRRQVALGGLAAGAALCVPGRALAATGWNQPKLRAVAELARKNQVAALMVSHGGRIVLSEGEVARPLYLHSMRKSIMSALYGIAVDHGEINMKTTLGEIGIDDDVKLTDLEKSATIQNLIEARSGVYIPASAEAQSMKDRRPKRGAHAPGEFWYYNNWDFNVLGNIYERITGKSVFIAFDHLIAKPLGMQDFVPYLHTIYGYEREAPRFGAYAMVLSARDMLRFGELYRARGWWKGQRIISEKWIAESTRSVSRTNFPDIMSGYGYLWWVAAEEKGEGPAKIPLGTYSAAGAGGHFVTVMPALDVVVVVRIDTFNPEIRSPIASPVNYSAFLRELIAAHPSHA